jgi:hypothetical protein
VQQKAALTYACLNPKKLAKKRWKNRPIPSFFQFILDFFSLVFQYLCHKPASGLSQKRVCLQSETASFEAVFIVRAFQTGQKYTGAASRSLQSTTHAD